MPSIMQWYVFAVPMHWLLCFMIIRDEIYVARKDSPMVLGVAEGDSYIASDVPAILKYTRNVYYIGNLEMARVRKGEITFYNLDGEEIQKEMKVRRLGCRSSRKSRL